eukprot:CAMPEP_0197847004 /NCGR_PEP_ID=MMETSP1438-20131217/4958_1 /TAXON_ID=1461541 /ORGANISM="Pterosperma sp., Strain CCMP1384" /LENGTH=101 /DNA_ID=CAMNT_0043458805 /DNA_START=417 /DNA_END=722 /DNA_ORIENTATION=-
MKNEGDPKKPGSQRPLSPEDELSSVMNQLRESRDGLKTSKGSGSLVKQPDGEIKYCTGSCSSVFPIQHAAMQNVPFAVPAEYQGLWDTPIARAPLQRPFCY